MYWPRPRRKRRSSTRWTGLPMKELTVLIQLTFALPIGGARLEHGLDNRDIAGAAAQIARQNFADARRVAVRLLAQERVRGRDHARRAEPALQGAMLAKGSL